MAGFNETYTNNKQFVQFFTEVNILVNGQKLAVGQKYSWRITYPNLVNNGLFDTMLTQILDGTGFNYVTVNNIVEIT